MDDAEANYRRHFFGIAGDISKHAQAAFERFKKDEQNSFPEEKFPTIEEFKKAVILYRVSAYKVRDAQGQPIDARHSLEAFGPVDREFIRDILRYYKGLSPISGDDCTHYNCVVARNTADLMRLM